MKYIIQLFILCGLSLGLTTSCGRENIDLNPENPENPIIGDKGSINLASIKINIGELPSKSTADVSNFIVKIFNADESVDEEWIYSEMPELFELPIGDYTIAVSSHVQQTAEFDKPLYATEKEFTIAKDQLADLGQLICSLKSIMVTIEIDESLAVKLEAVSVVVTVNNGSLEYSKEDIANNRAGYFIPTEGDNVVVSSFEAVVLGNTVSNKTTFRDVVIGEHRIMKYSLNSSEPNIGDEGWVGRPSFSLDVNMTIVDNDVIVDPGKDELIPDGGGDNGGDGGDPTPSGVPTIEGVGFNIDEAIEYFANETITVQVKIKAEDLIKNLFVTIDSDKLTEEILTGVGLAKNFDLAYPGELSDALSGLGFPVGDQVIGQDEILFDITNFTPLLGIYGAGTHKFIIRVVDQADPSKETTKILTLITK